MMKSVLFRFLLPFPVLAAIAVALAGCATTPGGSAPSLSDSTVDKEIPTAESEFRAGLRDIYR